MKLIDADGWLTNCQTIRRGRRVEVSEQTFRISYPPGWQWSEDKLIDFKWKRPIKKHVESKLPIYIDLKPDVLKVVEIGYEGFNAKGKAKILSRKEYTKEIE